MEKKLGYLGIDQYGQHYKLDKNPRKELLDQLGRKSARKMFTDLKGGGYKESGYIVAGRWIEIYEVHSWGRRYDAHGLVLQDAK